MQLFVADRIKREQQLKMQSPELSQGDVNRSSLVANPLAARQLINELDS